MGLRSFFILGFYFARQLIVRLLGRRRGLSAFKAEYIDTDGLRSLSKVARETITSLSRCVYCLQCYELTGLLLPADMRDLVTLRTPADPTKSVTHAETLCPQRIPLSNLG